MSLAAALARAAAAAGTAQRLPSTFLAALLGTTQRSSAATSSSCDAAQMRQERAYSSSAASSSGAAATAQQQQQEETLEEIRARVFETHVGNGRRSGRRPLLRPLKGSWIADWYFEVRPNDMPMLEDPRETQRLARIAKLKAQGKSKPKKGQGKRSGGKR